jgi:hypothetical protein
LTNKMSERKQFFIDNIGKRLYRNNTGCDCDVCKFVYENGIIPMSLLEATYLYDIESDFTAEGHPTRYFLTKEEVIEFEKELEKQK